MTQATAVVLNVSEIRVIKFSVHMNIKLNWQEEFAP